MSEIITCPSGLTGRIRQMKVSEAKSFSTRQTGGGDPVGRLLKACWEETIDPGPYELIDARIEWDRVLVGDRLYGFMAIGVASR